MDINFIYEVNEGKYIIWTKTKNNINNKQYFFWNIWDLNIKEWTEIYIEDTNFNFDIKTFLYDNNKKIWLKEIEENLKKFGKITWYTILNTNKKWEKIKFILWQHWEISYDIGIYSINNKKKNQIFKNFWKNIKLNIFPSSFFLIKNVWEKIKQWTILYLLNNTTKIINIEKWFYKNIEKINIWIEQFENTIIDIYGKKINNINNMWEFNKKVYNKELDKFLEPINIFIQNGLLNNNIYIIWEFKNTPLLLQKIWEKLKSNIIPIKIDNKTFKNIEQADIHCILNN